MLAIDLYSTSFEYLATTLCFFVRHETGDPPKLIKQHVQDFLVDGQVNQLASQYATKLRLPDEVKTNLVLEWFSGNVTPCVQHPNVFSLVC